jgi:alpha-L-arabinofuranosidase
LRDGIFAALSLHTFYRNADIVEYAMETQVAYVLQSLFETRGADYYKTPTLYVFKLLKELSWIIQSQVLLYWKSIV